MLERILFSEDILCVMPLIVIGVMFVIGIIGSVLGIGD